MEIEPRPSSFGETPAEKAERQALWRRDDEKRLAEFAKRNTFWGRTKQQAFILVGALIVGGIPVGTLVGTIFGAVAYLEDRNKNNFKAMTDVIDTSESRTFTSIEDCVSKQFSQAACTVSHKKALSFSNSEGLNFIDNTGLRLSYAGSTYKPETALAKCTAVHGETCTVAPYFKTPLAKPTMAFWRAAAKTSRNLQSPCITLKLKIQTPRWCRATCAKTAGLSRRLDKIVLDIRKNGATDGA